MHMESKGFESTGLEQRARVAIEQDDQSPHICTKNQRQDSVSHGSASLSHFNPTCQGSLPLLR